MQISLDGEAEASANYTDLIETEAAPFGFKTNDVAVGNSMFRIVLSNVPGPVGVRSEPFDVKHWVRLFGCGSSRWYFREKLRGHKIVSR